MFVSLAGPFYRFDGRYFEVHEYCGPVPLNRDGQPRNQAPGRGFWRTWEKFQKLSPEEREKYREENLRGRA